jgi:cytochrome c biogenesis protein CcmG, thiol:disulfide interchange protein DsbE
MKKLGLSLIIAAIVSTQIMYAGGENEVKDLPTAQVEDLNGKKLDFKTTLQPGKLYVISFWASWCVPCKKELNNMVDLAASWKEKYNAEIIAVSTDDSRAKSKVKSYVVGENWPFLVLLDQNQDLMRALGIQQIPYTLIVDGNGKIVYTHNSYVEGDEFEIENKLNSLKK